MAQAIAVSAFGGFLVAQQAAKRMLPNKHGAILFTGASASVKGYPQSAPFAMGKFALRGLAQSMARELSPQGIHVAHFVIDGGIRSAARTEPADRPDSMLDPDAIALELLERVAAAAQRLELGAGIAALGGEVLTPPARLTRLLRRARFAGSPAAAVRRRAGRRGACGRDRQSRFAGR